MFLLTVFLYPSFTFTENNLCVCVCVCLCVWMPPKLSVTLRDDGEKSPRWKEVEDAASVLKQQQQQILSSCSFPLKK